jgi:hypothetical protein
MVTYAGVPSPPWSWDHFHTVKDGEYNSVAARIKAEFWVSIHCTKLVNTTQSLVVVDLIK